MTQYITGPGVIACVAAIQILVARIYLREERAAEVESPLDPILRYAQTYATGFCSCLTLAATFGYLSVVRAVVLGAVACVGIVFTAGVFGITANVRARQAAEA